MKLMDAAQAHTQAHLTGDLGELVKTDQSFHEVLIRSSHNKALHRVYSILVPQLVDYRRMTLALDGASMRSSSDHMAIVDAIRKSDPHRARDAALAHLATLYREVRHSAGIATGGEVEAEPDADSGVAVPIF